MRWRPEPAATALTSATLTATAAIAARLLEVAREARDLHPAISKENHVAVP